MSHYNVYYTSDIYDQNTPVITQTSLSISGFICMIRNFLKCDVT